jgi:hypothetical protein
MIIVLDTYRTSVAAVVQDSGHTIGCILRLVYPSGFWYTLHQIDSGV